MTLKSDTSRLNHVVVTKNSSKNGFVVFPDNHSTQVKCDIFHLQNLSLKYLDLWARVGRMGFFVHTKFKCRRKGEQFSEVRGMAKSMASTADIISPNIV